MREGFDRAYAGTRHAATGTAVAFLLALSAHAAAPQIKTQSPGYHRLMLGDFEVSALSDGTVALPVDKLLTNTSPAQVGKLLSQSFLKASVETSVNGYLINTARSSCLSTPARPACSARPWAI